ncbi:hypothetical protein MATL_G00068570 [Megalops atlanticus]|uniref:Myb/SANT-like DNA-binding domain-containing protein n=1 Tax=Megalops atlanticus TaxID=7932 RepID=A0A9D3T7X6_MEGAT|nr:hypothetical protein MATL_G00068570 [Megalops atlanticus]
MKQRRAHGSDEDVERLIRLRRTHDSLFSGRCNAAQHGWEVILKEMGLEGVVSPARAGKKWENLKKTYKEVKKPPSGVGTESGEATAGSWKWYPLMDEVLGGRPSICPPLVISSAGGVVLECSHQHLRSRHCSCQLLPHLLTTGIWLLLRLVVVILHD